jgi:hypothetical protein
VRERKTVLDCKALLGALTDSYGWDFYCVPEPSTLALFGLGTLNLLAHNSRRKAKG